MWILSLLIAVTAPLWRLLARSVPGLLSDLLLRGAGEKQKPLPSRTVRITRSPEREQLGPSGYFQWFMNRQGLQLATYFWPVENAKGVVLLIHGHGRHTMFHFLKTVEPGEPYRYQDSTVEAFNRAGFSVCGLDNQSYGMSQGIYGLRSYLVAYDDLLMETVDFMESVKHSSDPRFNGLKLFVLGTCFGGLTAVQCAHTRPDVCNGAVLITPLMTGKQLEDVGSNALLKACAPVMSTLLPLVSMGSIKKGSTRKKQATRLRSFATSDPGCWVKLPRIRVVWEGYLAMKALKEEYELMEFPFVCYQVVNDHLNDTKGVEEFYRRSKSEDKSLRLLTDIHRSIVNETGWENVLEEILGWLKART